MKITKEFLILGIIGVDVRNRDAYNLGHIKGAISMPFAEIPLSNECLQPQRSTNNETVEVVESVQYGAS